jgi:aminocarboxymuconate-semialdehyde decarboxylase
MSVAAALGGWHVHTHLIPPAVIAAGAKRLCGMRNDAKKLHMCAHGLPLHPFRHQQACRSRRQRRPRRRRGLGHYFCPDPSAQDFAAYTQLVNDSLLSACEEHHPRPRSFACLPVEHPELAARLDAQLGSEWAGAVAGTELGALSHASERYDQLWQALSDTELPLFIYPSSTPDAFYLSNLLGNPVETTIAAANLISASVMHRFPALKVILADVGCIAALCRRWHQGTTTKRLGFPISPYSRARRCAASMWTAWCIRRAFSKQPHPVRQRLAVPMGAATAEHDLEAVDANLKLKIRKSNVEAVFGVRLTS